ncbi:putative ribosomal RNA processing protein 1 -like A isoform 2 [Scophthalmus maximus]|uniref:Putative ribosomal RNA processing protein 1-like A isoform 2 n=1 Tax=Scophthalmus maximus TaxID=52904 RepID=A0A2U9C7S1_SCOMX|nr:putative ribosomal RNA processing protein 1 -like A isoform 2 [Scophthalmus maximus]
MATVQEPEVQFAQKLASNEKPIRTKAIKKLRKYINVRSQKATGGFTGDELLKLWKGLFYCLWMQDKPLLQEELSNQISTLIHSFQDIDGQLLYLESFLQTFKREWTGIDRLRMDKFFQLVRFMFRQTFEMLKRKNWESSARFLELLTAQLLQGGSGAPSGLQFHILDLYMTELAAVGSAELTANQNLVFIEPFCKTAAKTKEAICNSIFSTVIDQAPFAIEELMKEVNADEDLDSGQASEEDDEDQIKEKISKLPSKKWAGKRINGNKSNEDEDELHSEEDDIELPCDGDIGPVLQFDYAALADKLFVLASRSSTPSHNRQRLYKIIKVLRDLGEGVFPQDEYPEEVSTDEDDEMFGSRKRMKRGGFPMDEDEEGTPAVKKKKGKKREASTLDKQNKDMVKDDSVEVDQTGNDREKKKKRKKNKKKAEQVRSAFSEESSEKSTQGQTLTQAQIPIKKPEGSPQYSRAESLEKEAEFTAKVTAPATAKGQSETLFLSEVKKQPSVTVTEEDRQPKPCTTDNKDQSEAFTNKKKKRDTSKPKPGVVVGEEQQTSPTTESEISPEADSPVSGKKKKKNWLKAEVQSDGMKTQSQVSAEAEITSVSCETSEETTMTTPKTDATVPAKKSRKVMKAASKPEGIKGVSQVYSVSSEEDGTSVSFEESSEGDTITKLKKPTGAIIPVKKNNNKKGLKADAHVEIEGEHANTEITSEALQNTTAVPVKKKTKKRGTQKLEHSFVASPVADDSIETPLKNKSKRNRKETKTSVKEEQVVDETLQDTELPLDEIEVVSSYSKLTKKKKRKIPVVFEFEADELETTAQEAASINGLGEEETFAEKTKRGNDFEEPSTPLSVKKSQKKGKTALLLPSDFITFQSNTVAPMPLFCKTKGIPSTPVSSKKKCQTPKSESKKVTFGLKNNKTAEFRKTDRSLLVSPDGSSRVPFDPKQKPKFGVLKSPPTPGSTPIEATTNAKRKMSLNSQKSTPKRRPSAADFF